MKFPKKVTLIYTLLVITASVLTSSNDNCEKSIPSCVKCDFNKKDCTECETSYFITQDNKCQECQNGCLQCFKEESCVQCKKFYTKNNSSVCQFNYGKLIPYLILIIFFTVSILLLCYWACLKYKNKRNLRILAKKTEEVRSSPLLTPIMSKKGTVCISEKKTLEGNKEELDFRKKESNV